MKTIARGCSTRGKDIVGDAPTHDNGRVVRASGGRSIGKALSFETTP